MEEICYVIISYCVLVLRPNLNMETGYLIFTLKSNTLPYPTDSLKLKETNDSLSRKGLKYYSENDISNNVVSGILLNLL